MDLPPPLPDGVRPLLVLDPNGHTAFIKKVFFTPVGRQFITVSEDKTIRIWDAVTAETLRTFHMPVGPGNEGALFSAALSPDGKTLAASGMPVGRGAHGLPIFLLSLDTGRVTGVLKGHTGIVAGLAYSPDGKQIASASNDKTARIWDLATGRVVQTFQGHADRLTGITFSPDGKHLATGSADNTARVWSVATGRQEAVLQGHKAAINTIGWSPDGQTVATGSVDGSVRLWEPSGKPRAIIEPGEPRKEQVQIISLTFSQDGRQLLYTGIGNTGRAGIIDLVNKKVKTGFPGHTNSVMHGALSPDGSLALTAGGNDNEAFLWSTKDNAVVHKIVGLGRGIWAAGWGADGKSIAWGNTNRFGADKLCAVEHSFRLDDFEVGPPPEKARRARHVGTRRLLERIDLLNIAIKENGRRVLSIHSPVDKERVYSFSLLDYDHILLGGGHGLYLVDLRSGKLLRQFKGHAGIVTDMAPSPDGRYFLTGSSDQTLCVFDPNRDEPVLSFFFAGDDWIVWTPEGYYACSAGGERLMGWQINNGLEQVATYYPAVQFRKSLYHPDVIRLLLPAGNLQQALAQAGKNRPQPISQVSVALVLPPQVAVTAPAGPRTQVKEAKLTVKAAARSMGQHPVTALRLLMDGRPYKGQDGIRKVTNPQLGAVQATWEVDLPPGRHYLAVQAESAVSKAVTPWQEVVRTGGDNTPPNLYVLAMGVSDYPGDLKLNFAASDATLISRTLEQQRGKAFASVEVKLVTDRQATRRGIAAGLNWLAQRMTARDVAVIFFSGHGDRDDHGNFFLVPADIDLRNPEATLVSGDLVKRALESLPGRLIFVMDACHSGSVAEREQRGRRQAADDLMRDLATDDYGVIVMCSSLGREYSLESPATRAGYYTLALIEGLSGNADFNRDGVVYFHELDVYTRLRVRELSRGKQNPTASRPATVRSFPLAKR